MKTKKVQIQTDTQYASECKRMNRCVRLLLANYFPETSQDIALIVLLRLSVCIAVDTVGRKEAPAAISRLVNQFLLRDHDD